MPPLSLMIKPASGRCNLRCRYCFYADETASREVPDYGMMSEEMLEKVLQKALSEAEGSLTVAFQGGEPTLRGLPFFERAAAILQEHARPGLKSSLALQTNGTLLDDSWCRFFKENQVLVGLSIDGTAGIHNRNRVDAKGEATLDTVLAAASLLKKHRVDFNTLTVVTDDTARRIDIIYAFFRKQGLLWQQYIPCLDGLGEAEGYLTAEGYSRFLCRLFDLWEADVQAGRHIYIRQFENYLGMLMGRPPEACGMMGHCTQQWLIEADGSTYPCDFYALDDYYLGNFATDSLAKMDERRDALRFIEDSKEKDEACRLCRYHPICLGGCRRDRDPGDGQLQRTRFCEGYQMFFDYALGRMQRMAAQLMQGQQGQPGVSLPKA